MPTHDQPKRYKELMEGIEESELSWIEERMIYFESFCPPEWLAEQRGTQPFSIADMIKEEKEKHHQQST